MWRPSPTACIADHAANFAVNAALVASQWVKSTQPLTPSTRLDRPEVPFYTFSIWLNRESNVAYQLWRHLFNQPCKSAGMSNHLWSIMTRKLFLYHFISANAFSGSINGDETAFDLAANASLHVSGETHINRSSIRLGLLEQIMITKSIEISKLYSSNHLTPLCAGGDCRVGVTADLRPATGCPHINRSIADVNCEETRALHGNGVVCNVTCLQGYQPTGTQKVSKEC